MKNKALKLRAIALKDSGLKILEVIAQLKSEFPKDEIRYYAVKEWTGRLKQYILDSAAKDDISNNTCLATVSPVESSYTPTKPLVVETGGSFFDQSILVFDIETIPNRGYFFDTFSDRGIPLQFVSKHKSVCTIAYKWLGSDKTEVLVMEEPYSDKSVLEAFLPVYEQARYVVAHYGDGFDIPFLDGRLFANKLGQLPKKRTLDTYKIAKKRFRSTLNSNKLDHLGTLLELGNKNKTDASLWVRCAEGDAEAIREMALYNVQDVDLLEKVFLALRPYFSDRINCNLFVDDPVNRCKSCGSENLKHIGYEMTQAQMRPQYRCGDCGAVSSFKQVKHDLPTTS